MHPSLILHEHVVACIPPSTGSVEYNCRSPLLGAGSPT